MPTYIVHDTTVMVHVHPLNVRFREGIPVSARVDGHTRQVMADRVSINGGRFSPVDTTTFEDVSIRYDTEDNTADIQL